MGKLFSIVVILSIFGCNAFIIDPIRFIAETVGQNCQLLRNTFNVEYFNIVNTSSQPDINKLEMRFYYKNTSVSYPFITAAENLLNSTNFNKSQPTVIFTHGFLTNMNWFDVKLITTPLVNKGNVNVLAVDTKNYILINYFKGASNVRFIGEALGNILAELYEGGIPGENIYLIGFSLGAQISGIAGKTFSNLTSTKISRITGLDPASPCFFDEVDDKRLSKSDANFVDVIHTDIGMFGLMEAVGHVDIYPNGGTKQPNTWVLSESHMRSWMYFAKSVENTTGFPAVACSNYVNFLSGSCTNNSRVYMGYDISNEARGVFYLRTSGYWPYYLGEDGLKPPQANLWTNIVNWFKSLY